MDHDNDINMDSINNVENNKRYDDAGIIKKIPIMRGFRVKLYNIPKLRLVDIYILKKEEEQKIFKFI